MRDGAIAQHHQECARKLIFVVSGTLPRLEKIQMILHQAAVSERRRVACEASSACCYSVAIKMGRLH
jgi:hypothetical protein